MSSSWNPKELKRLVGEHLVSGYKVETPFFKRGTIELQIRPERGGFIFYKVVADEPVPFEAFARKINVSITPLSIKQWRERFVKGTASFPAMAWDLRERLEAGKKVSQADVLFRELMDRGCIDLDQNVFCYTFPANDVFIVDPQPGQLVEVAEGRGPGGWPGRFLGLDENGAALIEQFAPVSYMRTPESLLPEAVKADYALPMTDLLGKGLVHTLEDVGETVPPGVWSEDGWEYTLETPILLDPIRRFCESRKARAYMKANPGSGQVAQCIEQAMLLHTLPLIWNEISLRPFPEGESDDVVVEIETPSDLEVEEISWPKEGEQEPETEEV